MLAFLTGHGEVQKGESTNRQVVTRSAPSLLAEGSEKASPQPHVLMVCDNSPESYVFWEVPSNVLSTEHWKL